MNQLKHIVVCYIFLIGALTNGVSLGADFSGTWNWEDAPESRTFSLQIEQRGRKIQGKYCAVSQNGNKIDCNEEDTKNIRGTVDSIGTSSVVEFNSFFGATKGRALLRIDNGHLIWSVLKNPVGGPFYAPRKAVLDRSK